MQTFQKQQQQQQTGVFEYRSLEKYSKLSLH